MSQFSFSKATTFLVASSLYYSSSPTNAFIMLSPISNTHLPNLHINMLETSRNAFFETKASAIDSETISAFRDTDNQEDPLMIQSIPFSANDTILDVEELPAILSSPTKKGKSGQDALPAWGRYLNNKLQLPLITHADTLRLHAMGGATWYFGGSLLLWSAWAREILWDDWSTFSHMSVPLALVCAGAIASCSTTTKMQPQKRLPHYSNAMRNGMTYGATLAVMMAGFATDLSSIPAPLITASQVTLGLAALKLVEDMVVDRAPVLDGFQRVGDELKLQIPPPAVNAIALAIVIFWLTCVFSGMSHFFIGDSPIVAPLNLAAMFPNDASSHLNHEMVSSFAAQMMLACSLGPAGEALITTVIQKEVYNNKSGKNKFLLKQDDGTYGVNPLTHTIQLIFNQPGPGLICIAVAMLHGHEDVVRTFFHL